MSAVGLQEQMRSARSLSLKRRSYADGIVDPRLTFLSFFKHRISTTMHHFLRRSALLAVLVALCVAVPHATNAQPQDSPPLEGSALSGSVALGGPAGGYTVGLEHLFVRTPTLQLGMRVGGSYARNLVWEGTASAITVGVVGARRLGALGDKPVALEGGLGVTRVHEEDLCEGTGCGIVSRTAPHFYTSAAMRATAMNGRLSYRVGVLTLVSDDDPFLLPMFGIGVGLF